MIRVTWYARNKFEWPENTNGTKCPQIDRTPIFAIRRCKRQHCYNTEIYNSEIYNTVVRQHLSNIEITEGPNGRGIN